MMNTKTNSSPKPNLSEDEYVEKLNLCKPFSLLYSTMPTIHKMKNRKETDKLTSEGISILGL